MHNRYFLDTEWPVHWFWPLQAALPEEDPAAQLQAQMQTHHWAQKLCDLSIAQPNERYNLIYCHQGWSDLSRKIPTQTETDVIIVRLSIPEIQELDQQFDAQYSSFDSLLKQCRATGLFFIAYDGEVADWYNEFIMELSHNRNVDQALESTTDAGLFYYQPSLDHETTLAHFVERLMISLDRVTEQDPLSVDSHLLGGHADITPAELSAELFNRSPYFHYDHESGEAEGVAQLSLSLFRQLSREILELGRNIQMGGVADFTGDDSLDSEPHRSKKSGEEASASDRDLRFLQAAFGVSSQTIPENKLEYLSPDLPHYLFIRIGPSDRKWTQGSVAMDTDLIFEDSSEDQPIQVFLVHNFSDQIQAGQIMLPESGASDFLTFSIPAVAANQLLEGNIYCFHKNRLLQMAAVSIWVLDQNIRETRPPMQFDIRTKTRARLHDLEARSQFGASLVVNAKDGQSSSIMSQTGAKLANLKYEEGLGKIVSGIKRDLEEAVKHVDDHPEDLTHENNVALLIRLALKGRRLFDNYLKKAEIGPGPIQIVTDRSQYFPLDFAYTFPAPALSASLCPKAIDALKAGQCEGCLENADNEAPHVCPFGFWTFSRIIERHAVQGPQKVSEGFDFTLQSEPVGTRQTLPILQRALFAATNKVEAASPGLIAKVFDAVLNTSHEAHHITNWDDWIEQVKATDPDSLFLLVHTEHNHDADDEQLEIGNGSFKLQTFINEKYIMDRDTDKRPLVILIGCNTQDTDNPGFDITSQFLNHGAPIVLSNFTKIRGRQAGPILMNLLEFLINEKNPSSLGHILLKLRQFLLHKGIMVSLALTAHGDADWKLKIEPHV